MASPTQSRTSLISHLKFHLQTKVEFASLPSYHFHVAIYAVLGAGARARTGFLRRFVLRVRLLRLRLARSCPIWLWTFFRQVTVLELRLEIFLIRPVLKWIFVFLIGPIGLKRKLTNLLGLWVKSSTSKKRLASLRVRGA